MRYAILSDIHDNGVALRRVLLDAERQNADRVICLGDVGHDPQLFAHLRERSAVCTFGNWEVSGLHYMSASLAADVGAWPATFREGDALFCHATPDMPSSVRTTADAARQVANGVTWQTLFPRLDRDEEAVWRALALMEEQGVGVAFHGHTHIQQVWAWSDDGDNNRRLRIMPPMDELSITTGNTEAASRYIFGVGSVGQPHDGPGLCYACYDDTTGVVRLRRLP